MAALCAATLAACGLFETTAVKNIDAPLPSARVKFHNFAPSSVGVNFFANGVKVTAISTTLCQGTTGITTDTLCNTVGREPTTGVVYGGASSGGFYSAIEPGQYTLTSKIAARDTTVSTLAATIAANKYYTFFMSGIYNTTTKTAEAFMVEDPIPSTIDYTLAHVRLVNAVSNGTTDMNLFATLAGGTTPAAVGTAVAYKGAGTFIALPEGVYDFSVRYTGQSTAITGLSRTGLSLVGGQVYTLTARGNTASAATMFLDFTGNQR